MPHIHTGNGEHDLTTSAFIVDTNHGGVEPRLLLHIHKALGLLLQPGGHVELDENPWQAIVREIEEETGYEINQLEILQPADRVPHLDGAIVHPKPVSVNTHEIGAGTNHKHTDIVYAFVTDQGPIKPLAEGESHDLRWLSLDDTKNLSDDEIKPNVRQLSEYVLEVCLPSWQRTKVTDFTLQSDD